MPVLNITNGDSTVKIMQEAAIPGIFLPWRDILHDGPVPDGLDLDELSSVRAEFISSQGWGYYENIRASFSERDTLLQSCSEFGKVTLWFEHDLYDQLQILQILDWFHQNPLGKTELTLICNDDYLGMLQAEEMKQLHEKEIPITDTMLTLAQEAWSAFRSSTPESWFALLQKDTFALPFLKPAIKRMLEEYPSCQNGLSRTASKALEIIATGESHPGRIFRAYQQTEESRFMGDSSFQKILESLLKGQNPLLKLSGTETLSLTPSASQKLSLTPMGDAVLKGEKNWLELSRTDRWIGGVHLKDGNLWCWDEIQDRIHPPQ